MLKLDKTYQKNSYRGKNELIHSVINRQDEIETSQIQLSGRLTQVIPHIQLLGRITKFIPVINKLEGDIFYSIKYVETDSESTLLNNSAIRQNTSFNIIKRFTLNE